MCDAFLHRISSLAPNGGELPQWGVLRDDPRKTGAYGARSTRPLLEVALWSHAVQASFKCISWGPWGFAVLQQSNVNEPHMGNTITNHVSLKQYGSQGVVTPPPLQPPPLMSRQPPPWGSMVGSDRLNDPAIDNFSR